MISVETEWKEFLKNLESKTSKAHFKNVCGYSRNYILPFCGDRDLYSMKIADWQRIINSARKHDGSPLSKKTVTHIKETISSFLIFCDANDIPIKTSTRLLYVPRNLYSSERIILQPDEIVLLFASNSSFAHDWYINLFRFLLLTGLRPSEALGLQRNDIHKGIALSINRGVIRSRAISSTKNKNAKRVIGLSEQAQKVLKSQLSQISELDTIWIFPNLEGGISSQSTVSKHWRRIAQELGTEAVMYGLRHTYASIMKDRISEYMFKLVLGHSANMSSYKIYAHFLNGDTERYISTASNIFREFLDF